MVLKQAKTADQVAAPAPEIRRLAQELLVKEMLVVLRPAAILQVVVAAAQALLVEVPPPMAAMVALDYIQPSLDQMLLMQAVVVVVSTKVQVQVQAE
jgi:hypothetical protein